MSINSVVNDTVTGESLVNAQKPVPPTITGYAVSGIDDTALDPAGGQTILLSGTGFQRGATVTLNGSAIAVVTYVNTNQLSFTSPAVSAGTYTIYAVNADGGTAIYIPGLIYSNLPTWTTTAGSLGSYYETQTLTSNVAASGDAPVTYSLFSGALPTGAVFNANGTITGSAPVDSGSTTYSFTVRATDAQLQDSTRSFSLTINVDAVTWVSPANATTYTSAVNSAIVNVALSATDAAGYSVSYSANALPTGLTLTGSNIAGTPTVVADSSTLLTATAATTNRTAVRTINWSITVANDVYFEYNTLLIPGASTTFVDDASTNNFAVTINGDTKPTGFNPYTPGYYSNYFDGSGDYLTAPASIAWNFTGDWTFECWVYPNSISGFQTFLAQWGGGSSVFIWKMNSSGRMYLENLSTNIVATTTTIVANQWQHIALTRSSNTIRMVVNGVMDATTATRSGTYYSTDAMFIGKSQVEEPFAGYISNMRILNGTALYTTTFTPPTTPLTAIANTSLLTCQSNRFIDNSTNNFTITRTGDTSIKSFTPFTPNSSYSTYGSGYFDGTGDTISVPFSSAISLGTGNFTMEAWCYPTTTTNGVDSIWGSSNYSVMLYHSGTSWTLEVGDGGGNYFTINGTAPIYAWNHMAVTRSGSTFNLWINGVSAGTGTTAGTMKTSGTLSIGGNGNGQNFTGYMTDFRLVKGTAVYTTAFTPPTAPLTAVANTSLLTLQNNQSVNNSVFLDNSTNNFSVTRNGNTTQGTFSPYGANWSNFFNGTDSWFTFTGTTTGSGNFTIESWIFLPVLKDADVIFDNRASTSSANGLAFALTITGAPYVYTNNAVLFTSTQLVSLGTWTHVALVRSGSTLTIYVNGVSGGTASSSANFSDTNNGIGVAPTFTSTTKFNGYISNLRVVNGTAVYTSAFTPSTTPLTPITNTSLLTCADNRLVDDSINNFTITKNGDVSVQRFSPFNPASVTPTSYSGLFAGSTSDYLSVPTTSGALDHTGDFTTELWIYWNSMPAGTYENIYGPPASTSGLYMLGTSNSSTGYTAPYILRLYISGVGDVINGNTVLTAGQWHHIAHTRASGVNRLFVNGVLQTNTYTDATSRSLGANGITIAKNSNAYVSNLRYIKGTAVYTAAFTPPTSPLTAIANTQLLTCQSPTFIDNSTNNFTITAFGNSQPRQQNPFGVTSATTTGYTASTIGGSMYSTGNGSYLTIPANNNFLFYGDYTIECWVYFVSALNNDADLVGNADGNTQSSWLIMMPTNSTFQFYPAGYNYYINSGITPTLGQWYHIAGVRSGTVISLYVNGVLSGAPATSQSAATYGSATKPIHIYSRVDANNTNPAYIADVRITNGRALYTSNFVPPSAPLTAVQNTVLLNNMTSAGIYDAAMMTNMQTVGDAKLSTAVSKFGGSSMSFDGSDNLSIPLNTTLMNIGTGDFTVQSWVYHLDSSTYSGYYYGGNNGLVLRRTDSNTLEISHDGVASIVVSTATIPSNQWVHVAGTRSGSTVRIFINGVVAGTATYGTSIVGTSSGTIGSIINIAGYYMNGYIDDLMVTKGYAVYTTTFTPPTTALPTY